PKSAEEIAHAIGAHSPSLFRLLRYLCAVGVLAQEEGERFVVTSLGDLLRSDHPESLRPLAILYGSSLMWRPYGELYASVVDGRCAFERTFATPFFTYLDHQPEDAAIFNAVMTSGVPLDLIERYDFSACGTIVDIGGGQGAFLQTILARYPQAQGILYDLPS